MDCPAPSLASGLTLFNQGHYYDCHDVLEALWMEADPSEKPFYQGILQIAVGLYHLGNRNWRGATILLGEGVNRLRPFEPSYGGVAVAELVDVGWAWLVALQQTGIDRVEAMAQALAQAQQTSDSQRVTWGDGQLTLPVPTIDFTEPLREATDPT
jgi:predicted metal-dependent hydrolase